MSLEASHFLAGAQVPEAQRTVARAGQEELLIRRKRDAPHTVGVADQPAQLLAAVHVPNTNAPVRAFRRPAAAAQRLLAVAGKDAADHHALVPFELADLFARAHVPKTDGSSLAERMR